MNFKKVMSVGLVSVLSLGMLVGCGSKTSADTSKNKGSDASGTKKTASQDLSGAVATNGSTSMESVIGNLSEQFMQDNPNVKVTYDATGSGTGIESVAAGSCDIGLASRALKDEEKAKNLEEKTIALDGIAIIVNKDSKLSDISLDDVTKIYTGAVSNWKDVGGDDAEIAAIGREAGSGTRDGFESITGTKDACKYSQELTSTGAVIEAVKNSPNAIGYASFSAVEGQDGIKALTVNGVECTEDNISNGKYVIQRPFNLITLKGKDLSTQAKAFFDYASSKDASKLIEKAGAVPTAK